MKMMKAISFAAKNKNKLCNPLNLRDAELFLAAK